MEAVGWWDVLGVARDAPEDVVRQAADALLEQNRPGQLGGWCTAEQAQRQIATAAFFGWQPPPDARDCPSSVTAVA